jgi:diamine N-acetyltransferase
LRKVYLLVDKSNTAAIHVYEKGGFRHEAELIEEFFGNGSYHNALRMCMFQSEFVEANRRVD